MVQRTIPSRRAGNKQEDNRMSNACNASAAEHHDVDVKEVLRTASGSLDPRTVERLGAGIDRLLEQNQRLKAQLARTETEREGLLNAVGLQGIIYDADGRVVRANHASFLEWESGLIGMNMQAVLEHLTIRHPDGQPVRLEELPAYRALQGNAVMGERLDITNHSGRPVHIVASATPIILNGASSGAVVAWLDTTEQEQVRQSLVEKTTQLQGLFDSLGDIVAIQLPDHTIVRYNRAFYELLGKCPEEVNGKKCYELIGREKPCEVCATGKAVETKEHQVVEKFVPELGGLYLECYSSPILNENGEVVLIVEQLRDITDRKRVEQALRASEHFSRQIAESAPVAIFIYDIERQAVVYANPAFESLLGYRLEEVQDMGSDSQNRIYHPEDAERWLESDMNLYQDREGKTYEGEYRVIRRDGTTLWAFVQERVFTRNPDGSPRQVFAIAQDITARKAAEQALAESEERFRSIFTTSHAVVMIIDPNTGEIVDANPAASAYYGYPHEALTAMKITDINTLSEDEVFAEMQKAKTGQKNYFAFRHRLENGEVRDVDVYSGQVVVHGRLLLHSIIYDVTGVKQAEKALCESENQFRALLDSTTDVASLIDRNGNLLALNGVLAEKLGGTVEDFLGVCAYELFPPEAARERRAKAEEVFSTGKPLRFTEESGGRIYTTTIFPIRDLVGSVERVAVIARDITEQKHLEQIRQQAFDQIERNIEQFAILADHIRQPLQVILGMADLVEGERMSETIQEQVQRINSYIKQLDRGWVESREVRTFLRRHELV
jgi:PAS domain S-box-containing protein